MHFNRAFRINLTAILSLLCLGGANAAVLEVDQVGSPFVAGSIGSPLVQSFTPAENNIAGVDVPINGTSVFTANVSVSLYSDLALTNLIASDSIADHPRNTEAAFRWAPVAVIPETLYYFEFVTGDLSVGIGTGNPYDRGNVINPGFNELDAQFSTYYDPNFAPVPVPAAAWLFLSALGLLGFRQRKA